MDSLSRAVAMGCCVCLRCHEFEHGECCDYEVSDSRIFIFRANQSVLLYLDWESSRKIAQLEKANNVHDWIDPPGLAEGSVHRSSGCSEPGAGGKDATPAVSTGHPKMSSVTNSSTPQSPNAHGFCRRGFFWANTYIWGVYTMLPCIRAIAAPSRLLPTGT